MFSDGGKAEDMKKLVECGLFDQEDYEKQKQSRNLPRDRRATSQQRSGFEMLNV